MKPKPEDVELTFNRIKCWVKSEADRGRDSYDTMFRPGHEELGKAVAREFRRNGYIAMFEDGKLSIAWGVWSK